MYHLCVPVNENISRRRELETVSCRRGAFTERPHLVRLHAEAALRGSSDFTASLTSLKIVELQVIILHARINTCLNIEET